MAIPKRGSVVVLVGTRKGAFILRSDARRKSWSVEGPHFAGFEVHHFILDPRDRGTLFAATYISWRNAHLTILREAMSTDTCNPAGIYFGTETGQVFYSRDEGRQWHLPADFLPPILSVEAVVV